MANLSDGAAGAILDSGVATAFPANSVLEFRSGNAPGPNAAPTGTLLGSGLTPGWNAAGTGRTKTKNGALTIVGRPGAGAGTAIGHYRLKQAADSGLADATQVRQEGTVAGPVAGAGTVTVAGGAGAATFSVSQAGTVTNGSYVTINGVRYTVSGFNGTTLCTLTGAPNVAAAAFTTTANADLILDNNTIADGQQVAVNTFSASL